MPVIPVFRLVPLLHLVLSRIFTVGEKRGHFVVTKEATMKHRLFFALQVVLLAMMGFWGPAHAQNPPPTWDQILPADDPGGSCPSNSSRFTCVMGGAAVRDNETGLVWEQSPSTRTFPWSRVDSQPNPPAAVYCNELNVGNRKGWRLPTIQELASLVDQSQNPSLPAGHPFSNVQWDVYWSATTDNDTSRAWFVDFTNGVVSEDAVKSAAILAWCVRGGQGVNPQ